ncbi:MAG: flavodoxin [Actinomycetes bacterium]
MRALIVYETVFGATEAVAQGIAEGLADTMDVETMDVRKAPTRLPDDVDLMVVGGPAPTLLGEALPWLDRRAATRERLAHLEEQPRVRDWLEALEVGHVPAGAAAFETRAAQHHLSMSGTVPVERGLRRKGVTVTHSPETFTVVGTTYLPAHGEVERARHWGEHLAAQLDTLGFECHAV